MPPETERRTFFAPSRDPWNPHIYQLLKYVDKLQEFVTGAFQIINLKWFIESGGLNPSLSKNFQDIDLCLKAVSQDKKVFYFGKENYLFHDESVTISKNKSDDHMKSDNVLFLKIWNYENYLKNIKKLG
jgi:GT2 family glycosyltransferase